MAGKVTVKDKGLDALTKRLAEIGKGYTLTVGVHGEEGGAPAKGSGTTLLEVATINEFGLGVPERSFIRDWADASESKRKEDLRKVGQAILTGAFDVPTGLGRLGALYQGEIQNRMAAGIPPPNAASTIARKGSSTPLIDTGQLRSSILWKVTHENPEADK